jgi:outer membrane protein assembly factor BamB
MKKLVVKLVLAIFCFSIIVGFIPGVGAQTNILINPGFENGLSSWKVSSGNAVYTIDTTTQHSGASSVMGVETSAYSAGRLLQDVTGVVTPGNRYMISGWIKTENVTGTVVIGLDYITSTNYTATGGYITEIGQVTGTQDWAFYESPVFTVPPMPVDEIALCFLFDFNMGGGTAWWDDVSLTLISQPSSTPAEGWPMFGHDLTNARYSTSTAPHTSQLLWYKAMDERVRSAVTVFDNKAYVGTFGGYVYALNASTGAQVWRFAAASMIWSTPTIANDVVYVGCVDPCYMYALNASTGDLIWNISAGISMWSSAAVVNNIVYFGSNDNSMYAVDAHTGRKIWNYTTGGDIRDSPAVVNGVVYISSQDGYLYALNATTGNKIWSSYTGDNDTYTNSSPAVVNNTVYIGSCDSNLYAFQATDGRLKWKYPTAAKVSSSPAVFNGVVYVGSEDHNLYAIDSLTGMKLWNQTLNGPVYSSPAVADGLVFIGSYPELKDQNYPGNIMYAFDASTGSLVWSYQTGGGVFSSPTIAGNVVFVGSYDNNVYAFGTSYIPGAGSSVTPTTTNNNNNNNNNNLPTTAWAPPAESGVVATVVTVGAVSIAAIGVAAATSASTSASGGVISKIIDKFREFLPKTVKSWIEGFVASKHKLQIDEKKGSPFIPMKSEIFTYILSVIILTITFAYVEVSSLNQFLLILPTFFATSIIVGLVKTYILTIVARTRGVWTEYKIWYVGVVMYLVSSLAFRIPFSSPTRSVHHSRNHTKRLEVTLSCAGIFITLGFAGFFFILLKGGLALIGGTGLAMCLIAAFFEMFPLAPMSGKTIFKYNKALWAGFFLMTLGFYAAWLMKIL